MVCRPGFSRNTFLNVTPFSIEIPGMEIQQTGDTMKNISMVISVVLAAVIIGVALLVGLVSFDRKSDYITVGGQSEVTVNPDRAVLYFTVNTLELTAQQAQEADTAAIGKIQTALQALGIDQRRIETSNYYLNKHTDWTNDGPVERGYDLTHTLKVSTSVTDAAKTINAAVSAGANGVDRIEFLVSREAQDAAVAEAMRQASVSAKEKAQKVTTALGTHMGRVLKIEEGSYWFVASTELPSEVGALPPEYQNNVIAPQRMAVQGNVNMVFAVN
jgi:uncharacterized protein